MANRLALLSLLAATVSACGSSTTPEPRIAAAEATGGTRLKARWYAAPEGPVRPHGTWNGPFHDTALDVDCGFVLAGDGAWRCLPFTSAVSDEAAFSPRYFADDKCATPLVPSAASCSSPPPTQIGLWTATCPVLERRLTVGAAIAVDASVFLRGGDGTCAPFSPTTAVRSALHLLGAEIDYPAYVAAERRDSATQRGYAEAALIASDGAIQPLGFVAAGSSELLLPGLAIDGAQRLLPLGVSGLSTEYAYANDICTTPAASVPGSCTPSSSFAVLGEASADACEWRYRVRPLGAGLPNVFGYGGGSSGCGPINLTGQIAFLLGSELPATAFPAAPPLSASTIGRLSRSASGVAGTWRWGSDVVRDTQLDSDVIPVPASDGVLRWLPSGPYLDVSAARYYSDLECTKPLLALWEPICPASLRYARLLTDCRVGQEVRPLTRFTGQIFDKRVLCAPATQVVGTPYAFGDPIPPDTFVPATIVLR